MNPLEEAARAAWATEFPHILWESITARVRAQRMASMRIALCALAGTPLPKHVLGIDPALESSFPRALMAIALQDAEGVN